MDNQKLFTPLTRLPFVGPQRQKYLMRLVGQRLVDLVWHLPKDMLLRRQVQHIRQGKSGETVTVLATVERHSPAKRRGQRYTVCCFDGRDYFNLVYFNASRYLEKMLPMDAQRVISGKLDSHLGNLEMVHPDYVGPPHLLSRWVGYQPLYPLTAGITQNMMRQMMIEALDQLPVVEDWLPVELRERHQWSSWNEALQKLHHPRNRDELSEAHPYRQRLAFDELLANQLCLHLSRRKTQQEPSHAITGEGNLRLRIEAALPFQLTSCQQRSLQEIIEDMRRPWQMLRLLQGDVGSGKTAVALLAAAQAIESGFQVAFLAPTDILVRQHFQSLTSLTQGHFVLDLLTGRDKGKKREKILEKLETADIDLLVGTHALIEDPVVFKNLGLVIVDEQHRFGVEQRLKLMQKGANPHVLAMSATPIPRTMQSILYGDMDVSTLHEKPKGRMEPQTKVLPLERLDEIVAAIGRACEAKAKIFWICPLVEESEKLDLTAAIERFEHLKALFGDCVGLIHGRMKGSEKDRVMDAFASGDLSILVSTTVVEVGVDVPEATVMVIENAQRFGLSQLHQLRGRIGRRASQTPPVCLLLYKEPLSYTAQQRLEIMRASHDGFVIAEKDLLLRGSGERLGTRQSGFPEFHFVTVQDASHLLSLADAYAKEICTQDPHLLSDKGKKLRLLLQLFEKDKSLSYLRSK